MYRKKKSGVILPLLVSIAVAGGCQYQGNIDNPAMQKLTWFSYLNGDGIRETCGAEPGDQYRVIYNGQYHAQLRSYEISEQPDGGGEMAVRVQGEADLTEWASDDILAPWRWQRWNQSLTAAEMGAWRAALSQSDWIGGSEGLRLPSDQFYWIVAGCEDGVFGYRAWLYPSPSYQAAAFISHLRKWDRTGIPFQDPFASSEPDAWRKSGEDDPTVYTFTLQVDGKGLGGQSRKIGP